MCSWRISTVVPSSDASQKRSGAPGITSSNRHVHWLASLAIPDPRVACAAGLPGWFWKLVAFALIWAYLFHFCAGLRHLWMDATHAVGLEFGRNSALAAIAVSTLLTLALGAKLFGLF